MAADRSGGDGDILGRLGELRECQDLFESAKQMLKTKQELHDVSKDLCAGCPNMLWKEGGKWKAVNPAAAEIQRLKEDVSALCDKAFTGGAKEADAKGMAMTFEHDDYRRRLQRLLSPRRRRGPEVSQQDRSQQAQENPEPQQRDPPAPWEPSSDDPPPWDRPSTPGTQKQAETAPSTAPLEGARTESGPDAGHAESGNWWENRRWQHGGWKWKGEGGDGNAAWSEDAWQSHAGEESMGSWERRNDSDNWHSDPWQNWESHDGQQNDWQQDERGTSSRDRRDNVWSAGAWEKHRWQGKERW
ncbi:unc45b [Symbiodinium sp. CCMP2456]|nr:unc45b [Symbiodinium sp. CCMP2456]